MSNGKFRSRLLAATVFIATAFIATTIPAYALDDRNFSGHWILKQEKSELNNRPQNPDRNVTIDQRIDNGVPTIHWYRLSDGITLETWTYPVDGSSLRHQDGETVTNSQAKWEGPALLLNTIVSMPHDNYTIADRWKLSRDGNRLTIVRHIVRVSGEVESMLVYEREGFNAPLPQNAPARATTLVTRSEAAPAAPTAEPEYLVPNGTHLPLRLLNSVSTKYSHPGERIYLQTIYPISEQGRIVIPAGSYVAGSLTEVKRAGRVKGKSELYLRFDSLTLPNGTTRDFRARISGMDDNGKGSVDPSEGRVQGESGKGSDAKAVATATAVGTGIGAAAGSAAGHLGMGAGIGAAAGVLGGLAGVLLTRGPDAVLDKGSTVEMVLDRDLKFTRDDLATHPDR
jgi:hypothetical protein